MSIYMLSNYVLEYPNYFEYQIWTLAGGFILGLGTMSGITLVNMMRAKSKKSGANLQLKVGFIIYAPIFLIMLILALFFGIATVWQFSIGFFVTAIFPLVLVLLMELTSKGKFFVQEEHQKVNKLMFVENKATG